MFLFCLNLLIFPLPEIAGSAIYASISQPETQRPPNLLIPALPHPQLTFLPNLHLTWPNFSFHFKIFSKGILARCFCSFGKQTAKQPSNPGTAEIEPLPSSSWRTRAGPWVENGPYPRAPSGNFRTQRKCPVEVTVTSLPTVPAPLPHTTSGQLDKVGLQTPTPSAQAPGRLCPLGPCLISGDAGSCLTFIP